jgi:hypothetical protein
MHFEDGIKYLNMTVFGRQWIANLHHHILCAEHSHRFMDLSAEESTKLGERLIG